MAHSVYLLLHHCAPHHRTDPSPGLSRQGQPPVVRQGPALRSMAHPCQFHQQLEAPCLSMGMGFCVGMSMSSPGSMGQRPHGYCPTRAQYVLAGSIWFATLLMFTVPVAAELSFSPRYCCVSYKCIFLTLNHFMTLKKSFFTLEQRGNI